MRFQLRRCRCLCTCRSCMARMRTPRTIQLFISRLPNLAQACAPGSVTLGAAANGKGIDGGSYCGHASIVANDWSFGNFTTSCTRFYVCHTTGNCQSSGITSAQTCAEKIAVTKECAKDYVEFRWGSSHCFCNPVGKIWVPDTSFNGSTVYSMSVCTKAFLVHAR